MFDQDLIRSEIFFWKNWQVLFVVDIIVEVFISILCVMSLFWILKFLKVQVQLEIFVGEIREKGIKDFEFYCFSVYVVIDFQ